jgi:hypothetical protein
VAKAIGVTAQSYCRWRLEYAGLKSCQARRPEDLGRGSARLKRAVADLTLDKVILKETVSENY